MAEAIVIENSGKVEITSNHLEITECKQRMYNLCVQSATQEYLENQAVNPYG